MTHQEDTHGPTLTISVKEVQVCSGLGLLSGLFKRLPQEAERGYISLFVSATVSKISQQNFHLQEGRWGEEGRRGDGVFTIPLLL